MYSLLIKHDYSHNDINQKKKMKRIILVNLNGHKLSFKLSLPQQSQRETPLLNANNPPRKKILPWGLMALRESVLNGYCPKGKVLVCVLEKGKI